MTQIAGIDSTIVIACSGIAILLGIALVVVIKKKIAANRIKRQVLSAEPFKNPLKAQNADAAGTDSAPVSTMNADPVQWQKETDCIQGMADISESLTALGKKYSLNAVTLATSDGLLLASSERTPDAAEIAQYSSTYRSNPHVKLPGVLLFGMEHKGSSLTGIIKTKQAGLQEVNTELIKETKDILNWWI